MLVELRIGQTHLATSPDPDFVVLRALMPFSSPLAFARRISRRNEHRVPDGRRAYAIGDIHGRLDLLERLLDRIAADEASRPAADTLLIFLGDLVDRGPESCGVVERLLRLSQEMPATRFIRGNHEEIFLRAVGGDVKATRFLVRMGGRETILSYGISPNEYAALDFSALTERLRQLVPAEHVAFLSGFERWVEIGDYLFVHAGVRPGVPIDEQSGEDLCWIRDEFLRHKGSFGRMVIHGHSITEDAEVLSNRIGIDTGAFATDRLTAIGLEGAERWFLTA